MEGLATAFKFDHSKSYKCLDCSDTGHIVKVRYIGPDIEGLASNGSIWDKTKLDNTFFVYCLKKFLDLAKSGLIQLDKKGMELLQSNPWLKDQNGLIRDPLGYVSVGVLMHKHLPEYRERNSVDGEHFTPCPKRCFDRFGVIRR